MKNKILALAAAGLLMAACNTDTSSETQNVNVGHAPAPGTAEDFKANIKDRVFFGFDKAAVSPEAKKTLEAQAAWFKAHSATRATVEGYTDIRGTREYNQALGARRAEAAKATLESLGVESARLKTISYGKDRPVAVGGDTEEVHAQNRVAVTVVE